MTRDQYLKTIWQAYPALPSNIKARGRIQSFKKISQSQLEIQLFSFEKPILAIASELTEILISGDIIAIDQSGQVTLLAPNLGQASSLKPQTETLQNWSKFQQLTRDFFNKQNFLEVATPSLVSCPGTEPTLEVFSTELRKGSRSQKVYLPTSPELHLKKCLHLGLEKIYEITRCYRNDELTLKHQPEFWMIEWYRAYEGLEQIISDVENYVSFAGKALMNAKLPLRHVKKTVRGLFKETFNFELRPETSAQELKDLALKNNVDVHAASSIDDLFFLLFLEIENKMNPDELIFVCEYPPYQAALARINSQGWAERFEVYWQGFELANAFCELNDPELQKARSIADLQSKRLNNKSEIGLDAEFFQALEAGMPPASGIALGLERLFMAYYGIRDIAELRIFPVK